MKTTGHLTLEEANQLVLEFSGWAESIARSVARAWSLDWKLDGIDGAAMEALIFCSRRFDPSMGVPFKGYSRRRIHEAATEQARKSRGWRRNSSSLSAEQQRARELSLAVLDVFPELREGGLPGLESDDSGRRQFAQAAHQVSASYNVRCHEAVRQLVVGAALLSAPECAVDGDQERTVDYKRTIRLMATLDPVHQFIIFQVYWEGKSLRQVASDWNTEGLNVIREHKTIIGYLTKCLACNRQRVAKPKVRPGLQTIARTLPTAGPFNQLFV